MIRSSRLAHFIFIIILCLTACVYLPSLHGGFLFDDAPNLNEMRKYGDMSQWGNIKDFITNGIAGPTGRPISLLTFVPQANDFLVGNAFPLKVVNLIIHLICGVLLYWATQLLLQVYGEKNKTKIIWVALLSTSFWLLHPFFVSTTAYVIQRMAQLPLIFSLLAIIGYLKGRILLIKKPIIAYCLMSISVGLGTVLATYSKENGALLPLLILIIEFCSPSTEAKPIWYWRAIFLWLPSITILGLLSRYIDFSPDPWSNRLFNQPERLLTEGRIVVQYLSQLFVPQIEGDGFFQDGYIISKGWLSPPTTLFSIIFLLCLLVTGFIWRKRNPCITLAILFFFAAHLMESTVIGLELYFEHRNYIAAIFLFLPLSIALYELSIIIKPNIVIFICVMVLGLLSAMTWQRSILWSNEKTLMLYWAQNSPNSARAQSALAVTLANSGKFIEANQIVEKALLKHPENGMLAFQLLSQKIMQGNINHQDFVNIKQKIGKQRADIQAAMGLRELIFDNTEMMQPYGNDLLAILDEVLKNSSYLKIQNVESMAMYAKGRIFTVQKKPNDAYRAYSRSLELSSNVEDGLNMVARLGNAGYLNLAIDLLNQTKIIYKLQSSKILKQSKLNYEKNMQELTKNLTNDLHAKKLGK